MSETEKERLDAYIAMCKCCLLAESMKTCPACQFNIGLAEKVDFSVFQPRLIKASSSLFALAE